MKCHSGGTATEFHLVSEQGSCLKDLTVSRVSMADFGCSSFSEGFDYTIPSLFKDIDFWFWKARMTTFIKAIDFDLLVN